METKCCDHPKVTIDCFKRVCTNCAFMHGYKSANEFVDFYQNKHRIRKKFIYHRKYHIWNDTNDIAQTNSIHVGYYNREKILRICKLIDKVAPEVNTGQKRIISISFILKQLFDILGIECKFIPLTKSKKTFKYYVDWWAQIYDLIKDNIN